MKDDAFMKPTCGDENRAGNCGSKCRVYRRGDCDSAPEPYMFVCVDEVGAALTEGRRYELVGRDDRFFVVVDDDGVERSFLRERFEFDCE